MKYPSTQYDFNYFEVQDIERLFIDYGFQIYKSMHEYESETEILDKIIIPEFAVIVGKKLV